MELNEIKVYRINDQVVWQAGDGIDKLEAIINRPLAGPSIKPVEVIEQAAVVQPVVEAPKAVRFPTGKLETKLCAAKRIYSEMVGASKADVVARFISDLNMTAAGAQTYYYSAKKG